MSGTDPERPKDVEIPQDDTEDVPYNPGVDTGFGVMSVTIYGREREIHRTHRLPSTLAAVFHDELAPMLRHPTTQQSLELVSEVYGARIKAGDYGGLFVRLGQDFPLLRAKLFGQVRDDFLRDDIQNQVAKQYSKNSPEYAAEVEKGHRSLDEANLREYFFSKGFDAFVVIAPEIDLEAPLSALCED